MKTILLLLVIASYNAGVSVAQGNLSDIQFQINHIAISVTDLAESEQFYRDVIGLRQIPEPFKDGKHAWFAIGDGQLHVIESADRRREYHRTHHQCYSVDDFEAFIERISSNGVTYYDASLNRGKINIRPDGIRQLYIKDPDGYWIEINDEF